MGRWREILTARELEGRFDPVRTGVDLKVGVRRCEIMPMSSARCTTAMQHRFSTGSVQAPG